MKLTYRGISYNQAPVNLEVTEGDILGKYRSQTVLNHSVVQKMERPDMESVLLHYRGTAYAVDRAVIVGTTKKNVVQAPAASCPIKLPQLTKLMSQDVRQVHLENMRQSLERRIQSAQARGDEHLVNLLRQESSNLWLSH